MVVARTIMIEAGAIVFSSRVLIRVGVRWAVECCLPERFIGVLGLNDASIVGQSDRRTKNVGQKITG